MKTKVKTVTEAVSVKAVEEAYEDILAQEKALAAKKQELQTVIHQHLDRTSSASWGRFRLSSRRSLSWRTDDIKALFPKKYLAFLKPDPALLKVEMETEPELAKYAIVKETQALILEKA